MSGEVGVQQHTFLLVGKIAMLLLQLFLSYESGQGGRRAGGVGGVRFRAVLAEGITTEWAVRSRMIR
jgi:hypothetical protein